MTGRRSQERPHIEGQDLTEVLTLTFEYSARPWLHNAERSMNHFARARLVREWRETFAWLARAQRAPMLDRVTVVAEPWQATARSMADVGACAPAVKAAVDGLVDASVLEDDGPAHLVELTYRVPQVGRDALVLTVAGARRLPPATTSRRTA